MDISRTVLFFLQIFSDYACSGFVDMGFWYLEPLSGIFILPGCCHNVFHYYFKVHFKNTNFGLYAYKKQKMKEIFSYKRHINYCINSKRPCSAFLTKLFYRDMWVCQKLPTIISHTD